MQNFYAIFGAHGLFEKLNLLLLPLSIYFIVQSCKTLNDFPDYDDTTVDDAHGYSRTNYHTHDSANNEFSGAVTGLTTGLISVLLVVVLWILYWKEFHKVTVFWVTVWANIAIAFVILAMLSLLVIFVVDTIIGFLIFKLCFLVLSIAFTLRVYYAVDSEGNNTYGWVAKWIIDEEVLEYKRLQTFTSGSKVEMTPQAVDSA
jgi:hypothetical protein